MAATLEAAPLLEPGAPGAGELGAGGIGGLWCRCVRMATTRQKKYGSGGLASAASAVLVVVLVVVLATAPFGPRTPILLGDANVLSPSLIETGPSAAAITATTGAGGIGTHHNTADDDNLIRPLRPLPLLDVKKKKNQEEKRQLPSLFFKKKKEDRDAGGLSTRTHSPVYSFDFNTKGARH